MTDLEKLVTGKGRFTDDMTFPDMLYLSIVRSTYARAGLLNVKGGLNASVANWKLTSVGEGATKGHEALHESVFAEGYVQYTGQPIAAVYADDPYKSLDLMESVEVDYEPMRPVLDPEAAINFEPIHPGTDTNLIVDTYLGKEFKDTSSPIVLEDKFINRRIATNPIEPRGAIARYDGKRVTLITGTQSVPSIKAGLVGVLGLDPDDVRVIQADTGGGFGAKGGLYPEYAIDAYVAMKEKRPVKWIETRREHLLATKPGRGMVAKAKLFADRSGKINGIDAEVLVDMGAYSGGMGEFSPRFIGMQIGGQYDIRNARVRAMAVLTNKVSQGPYRGAGRPEAAFITERMVDLLADELKMDPVKLRLMNATTVAGKSPLGLEVEASKPFLERAVAAMKYDSFKSRNVGFSFFVLVPAATPGESAKIVSRDGKLLVWLGGNTHGQRHEEWVSSILAEELGVPGSLVELQPGDSDELKWGVGSWGSRSAMMGASALVNAASKIREAVKKAHGKYEPDILLSEDFEAVEEFRYKGSLNSLGANLVTADVDRFGNVAIDNCISYYDVGKALNIDNVKGQIAGGMAQGIGQTLYEELAFDDEGQLLTGSIADAGVPSSTQLPKFTTLFEESRSSLPSGAKGLGESPTIGVPPALCRAMELSTGTRIKETPVRTEALLSALEAKTKS